MKTVVDLIHTGPAIAIERARLEHNKYHKNFILYQWKTENGFANDRILFQPIDLDRELSSNRFGGPGADIFVAKRTIRVDLDDENILKNEYLPDYENVDVILGMARALTFDKTYYLTHCSVAPLAQTLMISEKLFSRVALEAQRLGLEKVESLIHKKNRSALLHLQHLARLDGRKRSDIFSIIDAGHEYGKYMQDPNEWLLLSWAV